MRFVTFIVIVALAGFLIGYFLGDDGHEAWSRPLGFAVVFAILFPLLYRREKRKGEGG